MQQFASTLVLLATAALAAPLAIADDAQSRSEADQARTTEFKGRPPFARNRVQTETVDLARFEETAAEQTTRRTDFRGRPPFSRNAAGPRVSADFARFEETGTDDRRPRRSGPPGKMTSRR